MSTKRSAARAPLVSQLLRPLGGLLLRARHRPLVSKACASKRAHARDARDVRHGRVVAATRGSRSCCSRSCARRCRRRRSAAPARAPPARNAAPGSAGAPCPAPSSSPPSPATRRRRRRSARDHRAVDARARQPRRAGTSSTSPRAAPARVDGTYARPIARGDHAARRAPRARAGRRPRRAPSPRRGPTRVGAAAGDATGGVAPAAIGRAAACGVRAGDRRRREAAAARRGLAGSAARGDGRGRCHTRDRRRRRARARRSRRSAASAARPGAVSRARSRRAAGDRAGVVAASAPICRPDASRCPRARRARAAIDDERGSLDRRACTSGIDEKRGSIRARRDHLRGQARPLSWRAGIASSVPRVMSTLARKLARGSSASPSDSSTASLPRARRNVSGRGALWTPRTEARGSPCAEVHRLRRRVRADGILRARRGRGVESAECASKTDSQQRAQPPPISTRTTSATMRRAARRTAARAMRRRDGATVRDVESSAARVAGPLVDGRQGSIMQRGARFPAARAGAPSLDHLQNTLRVARRDLRQRCLSAACRAAKTARRRRRRGLVVEARSRRQRAASTIRLAPAGSSARSSSSPPHSGRHAALHVSQRPQRNDGIRAARWNSPSCPCRRTPRRSRSIFERCAFDATASLRARAAGVSLRRCSARAVRRRLGSSPPHHAAPCDRSPVDATRAATAGDAVGGRERSAERAQPRRASRAPRTRPAELAQRRTRERLSARAISAILAAFTASSDSAPDAFSFTFADRVRARDERVVCVWRGSSSTRADWGAREATVPRLSPASPPSPRAAAAHGSMPFRLPRSAGFAPVTLLQARRRLVASTSRRACARRTPTAAHLPPRLGVRASDSARARRTTSERVDSSSRLRRGLGERDERLRYGARS